VAHHHNPFSLQAFRQSGREDLNLRPHGPEQSSSTSKRPEKQAISATTANACTAACTSDTKNEQTDPVAALAAALLSLSPNDRDRLRSMLDAAAPIY
jgi:hypothetical protein